MDRFGQYQDNVENPARWAKAVVPSDAVSLERVSKALYIGGGGSVAVRMIEDDAICVFAGVSPGSILPVRVTQVMATGTTATAIVALA